jgi:hypothetical protein
MCSLAKEHRLPWLVVGDVQLWPAVESRIYAEHLSLPRLPHHRAHADRLAVVDLPELPVAPDPRR